MPVRTRTECSAVGCRAPEAMLTLAASLTGGRTNLQYPRQQRVTQARPAEGGTPAAHPYLTIRFVAGGYPTRARSAPTIASIAYRWGAVSVRAVTPQVVLNAVGERFFRGGRRVGRCGSIGPQLPSICRKLRNLRSMVAASDRVSLPGAPTPPRGGRRPFRQRR